MSLATAEAILFIGKAVRVLKQPVAAAGAAASAQALQANAEILGFCQALHDLQQREQFRWGSTHIRGAASTESCARGAHAGRGPCTFLGCCVRSCCLQALLVRVDDRAAAACPATPHRAGPLTLTAS